MMSFKSRTAQTVAFCYDLLDLAVTGNIEDYTEGLYAGNSNRSLDVNSKNLESPGPALHGVGK